MIGVSAWIMLLALVRDRAALAMAFVLPPLLFVVFAAIFSGTAGTELKLKLGLLDTVHTADSTRFVAALKGEKALRIVRLDGGGEAALRDLVKRGTVDVGLFLRSDFLHPGADRAAPIVVVESSTRPLAGVIALGEVQRTLDEKLPDVAAQRMLGGDAVAKAIGPRNQAILIDALSASGGARGGSTDMVTRTLADGANGSRGNVLYYAAAVSAIFLLFGAVHGAMTLVDERNNGVTERLRLSRGGLASMVFGKLCFLIGQGTAQTLLVYGCAVAIYGAGFEASLIGDWLVSIVLAAAAAASLALLVCTFCRSRKQAESLTTFAVLLVSAAGGSMVPRYLMPPWFQQIGWFTPNAWMIDALERAILPGTTPTHLALPWAVLAGTAAVAATAATIAAIERRTA